MPTIKFEIGRRRRCDYDGKLYTVRKGDHRFCSTNCRVLYHKQGSPLMRLRDILPREIHHVADEIEARLYSALDQAAQVRYRGLYPKRARHLEEWIEAEAALREQAS